MYAKEQEKLEGTDKTRASAAASQQQQLLLELDETKRDLDLKVVEIEGLQEGLRGMTDRYDKLSANQARLVMEVCCHTYAANMTCTYIHTYIHTYTYTHIHIRT